MRSESLIYSLRCVLRGLKLVFQPGFRRYVVVPVILNFLLFSAAFWLSGYYFEELLTWLIPQWLDWLRWLLWPLFGLSLLLIAVFGFTLVANLLGSFFYDRLSRKTATRFLRQAHDDPRSAAAPGKDFGLMADLRRLLFYIGRALPMLVLFFIPGINLIAPMLWLLFSAWFLAMDYMAYPFQDAGIDFANQRRLLAPYRLNVMIFGCLVLLGLAIPILNLFVPPAAVIGSTLYVDNKKKTA